MRGGNKENHGWRQLWQGESRD